MKENFSGIMNTSQAVFQFPIIILDLDHKELHTISNTNNKYADFHMYSIVVVSTVRKWYL